MEDSRKISKLHYGLQMEVKAEAWFLARFPGAVLCERNFRCRGGEIDLIFEAPSALNASAELIFVEVRARTVGVSWETGLESVRPVKQRRLVRTISVYLSKYKGRARSARLDILAWDGIEWTHIQDLRNLAGQS